MTRTGSSSCVADVSYSISARRPASVSAQPLHRSGAVAEIATKGHAVSPNGAGTWLSRPNRPSAARSSGEGDGYSQSSARFLTSSVVTISASTPLISAATLSVRAS
jgi:hypothetical protein